MIVAKWKEGFGSLHGNADPQKVASEIIAIGDSATPDEIVNAARDERISAYHFHRMEFR